jgi:hypothetical protein
VHYLSGGPKGRPNFFSASCGVDSSLRSEWTTGPETEEDEALSLADFDDEQ